MHRSGLNVIAFATSAKFEIIALKTSGKLKVSSG